MLQRISEIAVQASNDTNTNEDRQALQKEIAQIISEVDKVANTTEFNTMKLLDGTFANQANNAGGGGTTITNPFTTITNNKIDVTNSLSDRAWDPGDRNYTNLKKTLDNEIVPQAVQAILNTFSETFGYLDGSNIGIGLQISKDDSSAVLASVILTPRWNENNPLDVDLGYTLNVNSSFLSFDDATDNLTEESRTNLEGTIVHEMMHAFMLESLTAGMWGKNQQLIDTQGFPMWFKEGTAQIAGGGSSYINRGLYLNDSMSEDDIRAVLGGGHKLGATTNESYYGTGYLATLYLGYLASGESMDIKDIASGVDKIMNDVRGGKSLSDAIKDRTNNKFTSLADFEARFADEGAKFTKDIVGMIGNGKGAVVTGNLAQEDLLKNEVLTGVILFDLTTTHTLVNNVYSPDLPVISGGLANQAGAAGPQYAPSNTTPPTNPDAGNQGNGGTTPPAPDPDAGNNQGGQGGGTTNPDAGNQGGGNNQGQTGGNGNTGTGGTTGGGNNTGGQGGGNNPAPNPGGTTPTPTPTTPKGALTFRIGANGNQVVHLNIEAMSSASLGIDKVNLSTQQGANDAITIAHKAIDKVSAQRSQLGAIQNRLEHTINNLTNTAENLTSAESRICDTDMSQEMMKFTKNNILVQAAQAMLAQANTHPQSVLSLLG